jgi:hypothetical protein
MYIAERESCIYFKIFRFYILMYSSFLGLPYFSAVYDKMEFNKRPCFNNA